jgi:hypothetical protein
MQRDVLQFIFVPKPSLFGSRATAKRCISLSISSSKPSDLHEEGQLLRHLRESYTAYRDPDGLTIRYKVRRGLATRGRSQVEDRVVSNRNR